MKLTNNNKEVSKGTTNIITKLKSSKSKPKKSTSMPFAVTGVLAVQAGSMRYELKFFGRLFHMLYNLGFSVEYSLIKVFRSIKVLLLVIADYFAEFLGRFFGWLFGFISYGLREFTAPFATIRRAVKTSGEIVSKEKHYGGTHIRVRLKGYILTGIKKHLHLTTNPFCYILPLAAFVVFVYTAYTIFSYNFILQVSNNDLTLGYIENAKVVDSARQVVNERIQYQGSESTWSLQPEYTISVADALPIEVQTQDTDTLANNLILSSGQDISESTGLFVDGEFYGATLDSIQLEQDINSLLENYQRSREGSTISFLQEVEMVDGLFLKSSIVDHSEIQDLIYSTTGDSTTTYIVKEEDTVSGIASNYSITTGELISLNPDVDFTNLQVGQSLFVKRSSTFITVKEVQPLVFEETVEFTTEQQTSSSLPMGEVNTITEGENGTNLITAEIVYIDGVQTSVNVISTEVIKEPVAEVIEVGTALGSGGITYDGPALGSGAMVWPTGPGTGGVSRGFTGVRAHNGIDIWGAVGTPIYAVDSGVVVSAVYGSTGYGIMLLVDHGNGIMTRYAHNSTLNVSLGDTVSQGQQIAGMGSTGNSTGSHLHFEVIVFGTTVDPAPYIY